MQAVMGFLFQAKSVALIEDAPENTAKSMEKVAMYVSPSGPV